MNKKVAIIGTHGVGKTTLINNVYNTVKEIDPNTNLLIVEEQAREWITKYGFDWASSNISMFTEYEKALLHYFTFSFMLPRNILADRSPLDVVAYAQLFCEPEYFHAHINKYRDYLCNSFQFVLYETQEAISDIDQWDRSAVLRLKVENNLLELLRQYKIPYSDCNREDCETMESFLIDYFTEE